MFASDYPGPLATPFVLTSPPKLGGVREGLNARFCPFSYTLQR